MAGKRKWQEDDWEVVMAAQSFVAVLAADEAPKKPKKATKPTRRSTRGKKAKEDVQEDEPMQIETADEFWLAQLQDDVTEDMLQGDASVHVTWLNKLSGTRYERAYDEQVDVGSILCHVFLKELSDALLELTPKSLERVQRSVRRTKAQLAGEDVPEDEEEDNERPPPTPRSRRAEEDKPAKAGRKVKTPKLSKREAAMHIPPLRTTVDESKYEDRELFGQQPLESFDGDSVAANREVHRAVLTKNVAMLKTLTTQADAYAALSTFDAMRSADVAHSAIDYAIDNDDLAAAALLRQTPEEIDLEKLAAAPEVALPSHSTGQHTSRFSDYNRRAINASRGGKEGNNALLEDSTNGRQTGLRLHYFWLSPTASVEMLTLLYPTGQWTNGHATGINVCRAARCGNYRLVRKVVETLEKNGGWGFNELHHKVLADGPDADEDAPLLPPFRAVSAIKQAHSTRLRPLHLAAINPNVKYLEALWAVAGDEFSAIKDDQGYEPIHYAAGCESPAPMTFLLERRCGMFGRTKTRLTPLMCALEAGRQDTALALLKFAATPGESGGGGQEVADKLIRERGPGGKQAIHFAAEHGCAKVLEYLLTECKGAVEINAPSGGTTKSTPLTLAAQHGYLDCVRVLLSHGAKADSSDKLKKTALILAVKNGHTRVAAALINSGANVNAYDSSENSVVHYAASYGWPSCLQLLIDAGAELWAQNAWGFVPLACALLKQHRICAELILAQVSGEEQRKFLDFRDRQGRTMLFLQCQHSRSLGQLSYLLEKGLNPNIGDSEGEYPLQRLIARACEEAPRTGEGSQPNEELSTFFLEAVRLLLQHGAHPQYELFQESYDEEKPLRVELQPLQQAIIGNQVDIVDLLLEQDAVKTEALASVGSSAWMTAASLGAGLGDVYLSKLLEHHSKTTNDGPLLLVGRTRPQRENFFHVAAHQNASNISAMPELIRQCADKCPTTAEMMCEKDSKGYSPVMRLFDPSQERTSRATETDPDKLQQLQEMDEHLTLLVKLYAEKSTEREAFVRCVEASQLIGVSGASDATIATNDAADAAAGSAVPKSDGSDSDDDSGSADDDNNGTDAPAPVPPKPEDGKPKVMVEYETVLHFIAQRKLTSDPSSPWLQWYGCAGRSTSCLMQVLYEKRPELFGSDSDANSKSLVNFVHLGSFKTALHYAVESGDALTVKTLLVHHADANKSPVRCSRCKTFTLEQAVRKAAGQPVVARDSLPGCIGECGVNSVLETALFQAVRSRNIKCARLLLQHGADVTCFAKSNRETALHVALKANDGASVSALLSHGASLLARDAFGASPLHLAVVARHSIPEKEAHEGEVAYSAVNIVKSFPSGQPVASKKSLFTVTTSQQSQHERRMEAVEPAIVVALRDPSSKKAVVVGDTKHRSPVHYAARNRDLELMRELLHAAGKEVAKTAVNQRDWLGRTPLHYAVNAAAMTADASFAVERFLLQNGADVNVQDDFGFGALHFALVKVKLDWHETYDATHKKQQGQKDREGQMKDAAKYESDKREAFLRDHLAAIPGGETDPVETVSNLSAERGLKLMAQDALGRTALHLAAATGAFVCVSTLLSALGDPKNQNEAMALKDRDDFTPLGRAVLHKRQTSIMTLLRSGSAVDGKLRVTKSGGSSKAKSELKVKTRSYFYHAVNNGLTGICHMLLSAKFSRRQAIEDSIRCGQFQLANNLLGVLEAESDGGLKQPNSRGETLLHSLAKTQHGFDNLARKLAWALVDAGVDADVPDKKGNIAMHYAAKRGNTPLLDFLRHQPNGKSAENVKNTAGETPLLLALKQSSSGKGLDDDKLFEVLCYFLEYPRNALDVQVVDASGMNVLCGFLDRFTEAFAVSRPVLFFAMLETLLKRGADPNAVFKSERGAAFETPKQQDKAEDDDQLLRSGRHACPATSLAEGDKTKMPPLVRVAYTPEPTVRYHGLAMLLRYGAKLSTADGRGNNLLMHLAARDLVLEMRLALGLVRSVPEPKDVVTFAPTPRMCSLHIPEASIKSALVQRNATELTACHIAVQPLEYGSYENTRLIKMVVDAGGDLRAKDLNGKTPVDYARAQRSQFVLRFLQRTFQVSAQSEDPEDVTMFADPPAFSDDATAYLEECEASGKISRSRVVPKVNASCDVGKVSRVHTEGDGAELDALLTKVDVKNGRFGLNVFYRLQLVRDELQDIYVLFTNWGRIGETGKFQNTPFREVDEAVTEFKKIFRSKTGNTWEARAPGEFVKKPKKYNLVQRVNHSTKVDKEVTSSFREDLEAASKTGAELVSPRDGDLTCNPSVMTMLAAITDVHNLQLAAQTSCGFAGGELPLAKQDELRAALEKLHEIRGLVEEKDELLKEIATASGDLSDEGATRRALLTTRHEALTEKISERSSRYYEVMPCQEDGGGDILGSSSIRAFDQVADVNVEITRLKLLSDIMETYKMLLGAKRAMKQQNPLEYCYHALQVRLAPLAPADNERQLIHRYFFNGLRSHDRGSYRISNVFEVERRGESQRFNNLMEQRTDLRDVHKHLLWHGTKRTNLMGILSQGLRVAPPEAPHHGYAYGKGLYFADVAEKSLNYCDAPYALPILGKDGKPDKSSSKTREVHYMLLCEVALGKPTELTTAAAWGTDDPLPREGMDSVKALAKHIPDPNGSLVSPKCGALLHLGSVKCVGVEIPYDRVWAKTEPNPAPFGWYERNPTFTAQTQSYLEKLVADKEFVEGSTHTVSATDTDRALFVQYQYQQRTITIDLVSRASSDVSGTDEAEEKPLQASTFAWCQATLKITIKPDDHGVTYSYYAKLYRNALSSSALDEGYTLVEPALSDYAELIVYKEAQARIRYVVEVETV